jgi:enoyl-CoA hydratase/carnithine racemase
MFSSGGDLGQLRDGLPADYLADYWRRMSETILQMRSVPQIVIAAVEGAAVGAGAALALGADFVVAEQSARFRFNFVHLGLLPDAGTTVFLPAAVGMAKARDLLLSGRWLGAEEAHEIGLIARVAPSGELLGAVDSLIGELRAAPAAALGLAKNLLDRSALAALHTSVQSEGVYQLAAAFYGEYQAQIGRVLAAIRGTTDGGVAEASSRDEPLIT